MSSERIINPHFHTSEVKIELFHYFVNLASNCTSFKSQFLPAILTLMKLILIDGGPASGKNTLGTLLVDKFQHDGEKAILLDLDNYVEEFNPKWIWEDKQQEEKDQSKAMVNFIKDINKHFKNNFIVIAIGERFLIKEFITQFINKLEIICPVYLFHLNIPLTLRGQRLHQRGPHTLIDLEKDQKERDQVRTWPGYVYENINTPQEDSDNLYKLIQGKQGLINSN